MVKCKGVCYKIKGFLNLKQMVFAFELGFHKCNECLCYFYRPHYVNCKCCHQKLQRKPQNRKPHIKEKVDELLNHKYEIPSVAIISE